jgi:hypothetical protein
LVTIAEVPYHGSQWKIFMLLERRDVSLCQALWPGGGRHIVAIMCYGNRYALC